MSGIKKNGCCHKISRVVHIRSWCCCISPSFVSFSGSPPRHNAEKRGVAASQRGGLVIAGCTFFLYDGGLRWMYKALRLRVRSEGVKGLLYIIRHTSQFSGRFKDNSLVPVFDSLGLLSMYSTPYSAQVTLLSLLILGH